VTRMVRCERRRLLEQSELFEHLIDIFVRCVCSSKSCTQYINQYRKEKSSAQSLSPCYKATATAYGSTNLGS